MPPRPTTAALSVFSGLGGLDLGARIAGLSVDLATDRDAEALTLLARATGVTTLAADIDEAMKGALPRLWTGRWAPRILIGGPPCTPFSHAGFWLQAKRSGEDPATSLLASYVTCLDSFRPDAFVLENVPGLAFRTHDRFLRSLVARARCRGYKVTSAVLCASDFGVAQARRRLFVVGVRPGNRASLERWPSWPT